MNTCEEKILNRVDKTVPGILTNLGEFSLYESKLIKTQGKYFM